MNVKIEFNVEPTDRTRLAIARLTGRRAEGLASRDTVKLFFKTYGLNGYELIAEEIGRINEEAARIAKSLATEGAS
jgi:hypothetical protein